jgi:hypothetical protein
VNPLNVDASRRFQVAQWTLALALEPSILVNSTGVSWQRVCLPPKSYIVVDVDDQAVV